MNILKLKQALPSWRREWSPSRDRRAERYLTVAAERGERLRFYDVRNGLVMGPSYYVVKR
jgi:hypothetical protein